MQHMLGLASQLMRAIDTPRSLSVAILIRYGEWGQLADLRVDPLHYLCARALALDTQATDLLRKLKELPTGRDLEAAAIDSFWQSEQQCARTNARVRPFLDPLFSESPRDLEISDFLKSLRSVARRVLGSVPPEVDLRFGPGATFDDKTPRNTIPDKMTSLPTVLKRTRHLLPLFERTAWGRQHVSGPLRGHFREVRGDRFATVPKDGTKDRGIGIGPSINVSFQLGIGRVMRSRLARSGIDLAHGQNVHRQVACESSITDEFATIDLSNASDTVARTIVQALLPEEWFSLLDDLRSPTTLLKGKTVYLEKFSAMGNGYTFELETLLFASIAEVCMRRLGVLPIWGVNLFVYGDDIIVPVGCASTVLSALRFCGFTANQKKTFVEGSFRESCGGDYFDGQPVRAHFLDDLPNEPHEWISLANGLRRFLSRFNYLDVVRLRLLHCWHRLLDNVPSDIRKCRGPSSLGDLVIHDTRGWQTRSANSRSFIRTWSPIRSTIPWYHWRGPVVLAAALYGVQSNSQVITVLGNTDTGERVPVGSTLGGLSSREVSGYQRRWAALLERVPVH